jgi:hypothetical protein
MKIRDQINQTIKKTTRNDFHHVLQFFFFSFYSRECLGYLVYAFINFTNPEVNDNVNLQLSLY